MKLTFFDLNVQFKIQSTWAWFKVVCFNEMKKFIGGISYKTLSSTLKELEANKLVHREEYLKIPLKVEYSLT